MTESPYKSKLTAFDWQEPMFLDSQPTEEEGVDSGCRSGMSVHYFLLCILTMLTTLKNNE